MNYEIENASQKDKDEILALYRMQIGREFCPWDEHYPSEETIEDDLSRDALFALKMGGKIKAVISIDEDELVIELPCWSKELVPAGELARLCVLPEEQNKGLARVILQFGMDELKRRGYKGVHFLVNKYNVKALRSYQVFGCRLVGECHLYDQDYFCYEKEL